MQGDASLHVDHREGVPDHVVHFPGDLQPFLVGVATALGDGVAASGVAPGGEDEADQPGQQDAGSAEHHREVEAGVVQTGVGPGPEAGGEGDRHGQQEQQELAGG